MKINKKYEEMDNSIIDVDEIAGTDVKINPDYYIHNALVNAQKALNEEDITAAFNRFRVWVEHAQDLADAAGMLTDDYYTEVRKIPGEIDAESKEAGEELKPHARMARISSRKLKHIMKQVFSNKVSTGPLRL